ncbi:class I SAM-dependent methyltransferase [Sulfitobacter sp. D35]|uniref:class I SAM-dependent methyltransferase n=1 Tax=Sulfitobacter sp. D35 TaxID=3083252 RepID=UPI00296E2848|nr:class I SAM-dependent methyltransferase [Sulfitobacter sp. D35]MDW4497831.1 class I SAM-dependent methyltransferase [Sulfitobacter sp. D35]
MAQSANSEQETFWSDEAGPLWVRHADGMDRTLRPVLERVVELAEIATGAHILDIGCGTGASLQRLAEAVGPEGRVLGVDISTTMLASAEVRVQTLSQVRVARADAATYEFSGSSFDGAVSRFGVMFFTDPAAAFANIGRSLKPGAAVTFAAWGAIEENPWFVLPAQAAKAVLGAPPPVDPDEPGPFAFRDPDRVRRILNDAGFTDIEIAVEHHTLTPEGSLEETAAFNSVIGPAGRTITHFQADEDARLAVRRGIEKLFTRFVTPDGLRVPAQINFCRAKAPD